MKRIVKLSFFFGLVSLGRGTLALDESKIRTDMIDFDQRKSGLPNDGSMYCVPTSQIDILRYLKLYGMSNMMASYTDSYSDITNFQIQMGLFMFTSPTGGTSGGIANDISDAWIFGHNGNKVVYTGRYGPSSNWSYRTVMNLFRQGSLIRIGRGVYKKLADGRWYRDGGHAVCMAGYSRVDSGSAPDYFFIADPADEYNLNSQGTYMITWAETSDITFTTVNYGTVTHARYTNHTGPSNNERKVVDSLYTVTPAYAGWTAPTDATTNIKVKIPWQMNPMTHEEYQVNYNYVAPDTVLDWCLDPSDFSLYYVTPTGVIKHYDHATQTTTTITTLANARQLVVGGPNMDLYVRRPGLFSDQVSRVARKDGSILTRTLPERISAIDVSDKTGGVVGLTSDLKSIRSWDPDFRTSVKTNLMRPYPVPPDVTIQTGTPLLSIDSATGDCYVAVTGGRQFERFVWSGNQILGRMVQSSVSNIQDLTAGPDNLIFIRDGNNLLQTVNPFGVAIVTDFTGLSVGAMTRVPKSFTMHKAGELEGTGWFDSPPGQGDQ